MCCTNVQDVIPAEAGIQSKAKQIELFKKALKYWIPAFAGMTLSRFFKPCNKAGQTTG
ncbi:hypothetical protein Rh054_06350 [Rickettsia conorii subsp. heilongjiangensis 054]|nr:hypothetical protein Rh054_06350 [Rickettsia conorii subsp. heilongjiangensis 054]